MECTCLSNVSCFQSRRFSKKKIFLWRDLWDSVSLSWKDWSSLARDFSLSSAHETTLKDIIGLIPHEELFNMNIGMVGPFGVIGSSVLEAPSLSMTLVYFIPFYTRDMP